LDKVPEGAMVMVSARLTRRSRLSRRHDLAGKNEGARRAVDRVLDPRVVPIYLPGAGWVEFDPTNGIIGNRDLIRVAVARDPSQAVPLSGTYVGNSVATHCASLHAMVGV
jgi:hypothetical protein